MCQPLHFNLDIYAIQPATNTHTHTPLCKPYFAYLSEKTCQKVPTIPVDTPVPLHTVNKMIYICICVCVYIYHKENEASSFIFRNAFIELCFSEAIQIRIHFFLFAQSYIPVKVYKIDLKQTGSSLKKCIKFQ